MNNFEIASESRRLSYPRARRIALVSDSHGQVRDAVLDAVAGADLIVHAGDVGAESVLLRLNAIAPTLAVRGNNDTARKWPPADHRVLRDLGEVLEITLDGGLLVVVHGHQWPRVATRHAGMRERFAAACCVVYGHSHRQVIDCHAEPWVVNPGACGRSRAYGGASWMGLSVGSGPWRVTAAAFA